MVAFFRCRSSDFVDDCDFRRKAQRASAALYINVDARNGNLIKVFIFVEGLSTLFKIYETHILHTIDSGIAARILAQCECDQASP